MKCDKCENVSEIKKLFPSEELFMCATSLGWKALKISGVTLAYCPACAKNINFDNVIKEAPPVETELKKAMERAEILLKKEQE